MQQVFNEMDLLIGKFVYALACMNLMFIGYKADEVVNEFEGGSVNWVELIIGPLGALVLSVIAMYIMAKYLQKKDQKISELYKKLLEEKDKRIDDLKR